MEMVTVDCGVFGALVSCRLRFDSLAMGRFMCSGAARLQRRGLCTARPYCGCASGSFHAVASNKQLQRTVMDKVPRHIRQRAAAELQR